MLATVRAGLVARLDAIIVDDMLAAYQEAKRNYYLGGQRLSAVEGGRFCEAVFRMLQQRTTGAFDRLGKQLDSERIINSLANMTTEPDAVRFHIPRSLRVVYDIRNKRNNAHLADGIDPNLQDATLVISVLDWVLAELVRLYHSVPPDEARRIVEGLVTRSAPSIQDFAGFQKVLRTDLGVTEFVLLLLYARSGEGATLAQIREWVRPKMRTNLSRALAQLEHGKAFIHTNDGVIFITTTGQRYVETKRLMDSEPVT